MFQKGNDDECYFINRFISGLTEDKRQCFLIYIPNTLARMHEATADGATKRNRTQNRTPTYSSNFVRKNTPNYSPVVQEVNTNPHTIRPTRKILSTAEMRARREKGLCYNCEEQFTPGHKCKRSHMFFLITKKEQVDYLAPTQGTNQLNESQREEMVIS